MALGGFIKLIQTMSKSAKIKAYQQEQDKKTASIKNAAAQQRKALKDAEVTDTGDASQVKDAAKIDEEEKEALLRHKKETEQGVSERKKKGNIVSTFIATIVEFAETLPIAITLVQLVALFLALIIIVVIIINFIIALTTLTVDTSADLILEDSAFHFQNAYQTSFKDYTDKKGVKHKSITITIPSEDPDEPPEVIVTDNIEFWMTLSDANIEKYLVNDIEDLNQKVQTTNLFRMIRMAYRLCYTEDENGEYYIAGMDPEVLLGLTFFEKGYDWLQLYTSKATEKTYKMLDTSSWATYDDTVNGWVLHDMPADTSAATATHAQYANVDKAISSVFIRNPIAGSGTPSEFIDGPFSFSAAKEYYERGEHAYTDVNEDYVLWFSGIFNKYTDKDRYTDYLTAIMAYPEYADMAKCIDLYDCTLMDSQHYLIGSLLYSMLLTVMMYDKDWYDGTDDCIFASRLLYLKAFEHTSFKDGSHYELLGYNKENFPYKNALEYYLCKLKGVSSVSEEELNKYTRRLALCTYYSYHHLPYFASQNLKNYAELHIMPIGEKFVNRHELKTAKEYYKGLQPLSTVFFTAQGLLTTMVLVQADGDMANYTLLDVETDLDNTVVPWNRAKIGDGMYVAKSGMSGNFFDGRTKYTWNSTGDYGQIDSLITAFNADTWCGLACVRWDLCTSAGEAQKLSTSIMGAAVDTYSSVVFDNGKTLNELLTPLNFEAKSATSNYSNNRAHVVEGTLSMLMGGLITNRWFNICADRMVTVTAPPKVTPGALVDGSWVFPNSRVYAVSALANLGESETKSITDCELQNSIFVILDNDKETAGIQSIGGRTGYISQGSGYYTDGVGKHLSSHNSFDFAISSTGDSTVKNVYYSRMEYYFDYISYALGFRQEATLDMYTTEGYKTYMNKMSTQTYNDLNALTDRISCVSLADAKILSVTFNVFGSTKFPDNGNSIYLEYYIPYAADERGYKAIQVLICHLGSDLGMYWMNYLAQNCGITPAEFTQMAQDKGNVTYNDKWVGTDGDIHLTVPTSMEGKSAHAYYIDLSAKNIYVPRGTHLGYLGATGYATGPHYHGSIPGTYGGGKDTEGNLCDNGLAYAQLFGLTGADMRITETGSLGTTQNKYEIYYYPFHCDWFLYYNKYYPTKIKYFGVNSSTLQDFVDLGWIEPYWSENSG